MMKIEEVALSPLNAKHLFLLKTNHGLLFQEHEKWRKILIVEDHEVPFLDDRRKVLHEVGKVEGEARHDGIDVEVLAEEVRGDHVRLLSLLSLFQLCEEVEVAPHRLKRACPSLLPPNECPVDDCN